MASTVLRNREEAGRLLAMQLESYRRQPNCVVVALPRGGVITAFEIAGALGLPLDVLIVRKLGVPGQPELAFGAIASGGVRVLNPDLIAGIGLNEREMDRVAAAEQAELERRERVYRQGRPALDVLAKTVILVDDGVATGATLRAAVRALRMRGAGRIVVAVGVAPAETIAALEREVDEVRVVLTPLPFGAISLWFRDFPQTSDLEVLECLRESRQAPATAAARQSDSGR